MLDLDTWREILDTARKNKLRTLLTGFSVAWGIFMLVVLLGSGQGLRNGVEHQFRDDAANSIWVFPGQTSVPFRGFKPGRQIQLTNLDHEDTREHVPGVEHITSRFFIKGAVTVSYRDKHGTFDTRAVHPDHLHLERTVVTQGRFLNDLDLAEHRKVAAIGRLVKEELLGTEPAIGKLLRINGIAFQVVGVFEDAGPEQEMQKIYLPITTAQRTFNGANRIRMFMLTTDRGVEESKAMAATLHDRLADRHDFAADDKRAVYVSNNLEEYAKVMGVIRGIRTFVWVVGVGTLLAGVVGVSNIMLVVVRERTKEFGVRKALGATPWSIVALVLQEAVAVTAAAGYLGLVLGLLALEILAKSLPAESSFFRDPSVDLATAIQATVVLVLAGTAAGLVPARRAARIHPVEALRDE